MATGRARRLAAGRPAPAPGCRSCGPRSRARPSGACVGGGLPPSAGRLGGGLRPAPADRRRARSVSRHSTNWSSSLALTSASTPRPNWATLPVTVRSVTTVTAVPSPSRLERGGDGGVGVALAPGLAALGPEHGAVRRLVLLDERGLALVLRGDGADLDLDDAAVLVALDLLQLGARQAGRDALDVGEHRPRPLDGHAPPGTRWSAPSLEVLHGVDVARPGRCTVPRARGRAARRMSGAGALVAGRRAGAATRRAAEPHGVARDGRRRSRPRSAARPARPRPPATPPAVTTGWSARPTTIASWPASAAASHRGLQRGRDPVGPALVRQHA